MVFSFKNAINLNMHKTIKHFFAVKQLKSDFPLFAAIAVSKLIG